MTHSFEIWRRATPDGPRNHGMYLRWLAAQWEVYRTTTEEGLVLEAELDGAVHLMREPFEQWLIARFNS